MSKTKKVGLIVLGVLIIGLGLFIYMRFFYVFGEGVKTGHINVIVKKGYVFKTYEGKLIQSGFRSKQPNSMSSIEFEFSVEDKNVAEQLMHVGGREIELHYKEYLGTIPWRGYSKYIVDGVSFGENPSVEGESFPYENGNNF